MGVQVAGNHWPQLPPHPLSYSTTTSSSRSSYYQSAAVHSSAAAFSSRKSLSVVRSGDRTVASPFLLGARPTALRGTQLYGGTRGGRRQTRRRVSDTGFGSFTDGDEDDEEFVKRILDLALKLQREQRRQEVEARETGLDDDEVAIAAASDVYSSMLSSSSSLFPHVASPTPPAKKHEPLVEPPWAPVQPQPLEWPAEVVPAFVEQNAKRVELPLSLRIIKQKKKQRWGAPEIAEVGESACCSVKKAFSSMVFIIRELQSYALQLRRVLFYEDLQEILDRVQMEMNSSFVWLFQQVFSCTPTLMVSVMLLLANFTVYSMGCDTAIAALAVPPQPQSMVATEIIQPQSHHQGHQRIDRSAVKTCSIGKTASVGGNDGSKARPVAGATDDGRSDEFFASYRTILPDGTSPTPAREAAAAAEERQWLDMLEEARRMKATTTDEALMDLETLLWFVSPVTAVLEAEDYEDSYLRTELMYQHALSLEPDNGLLLANFAQFLYLVLHDHDRAEYYFERAVDVRPADAEALSQYASFLWRGKRDLAAAEEAYLEAIAVDPINTFHAANYSHFLWSTGGVNTCNAVDSRES